MQVPKLDKQTVSRLNILAAAWLQQHFRETRPKYKPQSLRGLRSCDRCWEHSAFPFHKMGDGIFA